MGATVVVGGQFGDEGKGKVVSYLALNDNPAGAARGGVGPNAGHTATYQGRMYRLRMLPTALVNPKVKLMIGPGVLIDAKVLLAEISSYDVGDRVMVDHQCGIIEDGHIARDSSGHLKEEIGTTGTGTGPANSDRVLRVGKVARDVDSLAQYLGDVAGEANRLVDEGLGLIVEGTQGTFLSLYHGTYPHVTSKDVTASGICSDIGLGPKKVGEVMVVLKSYTTRVGRGPLEDELSQYETVKRGWVEYGTVTGRLRRAAPLDLQLAKRSIMLNGATQIALTKLDSISPDARGVRTYGNLPAEAKKFVHAVEEALAVKVTLIGTGPDAMDMIDLRGV